LELIADFSSNHGLGRDEVSHIPIDFLLSVDKYSDNSTMENKLKQVSKQESERHDVSVAIRLPQLLTDKEGVYIIPFQVGCPNFITHKKIIGRCVVINSRTKDVFLDGKIVLIEGADPGFDWIFSQRIAGLITKYGGVNSHMAIRCAEFEIPAAIGCGEQSYESLLRSDTIHLDCSSGLVKSVH
jgi:phosphohistidine swiveling domain-containing protein